MSKLNFEPYVAPFQLQTQMIDMLKFRYWPISLQFHIESMHLKWNHQVNPLIIYMWKEKTNQIHPRPQNEVLNSDFKEPRMW